MASRTLYKLSLLKISLFILLLSSYRLQGSLASSQEENPELNQGEKVKDDGESELVYEQRERGIGEERVPHVFVGILARNVAYLLSNFFGCLENLDYPKESMTIWIRSDHNQDNTSAVLSEWAEGVKHLYRSIDLQISDEWLYDTEDPFEMPDERYKQIARLRQAGLEAARAANADYLMWVDTDNFIVNNRTLWILIEQQKPIVAPMLLSGKESSYSNFWGDQLPSGYYKRSPEYIPTVRRKRVGCFKMPVVHSTVLIDLNVDSINRLFYWPQPIGFTGPVDDVIQFAFSAKKEGVDMYVLNTEDFGYIMKMSDHTHSSLQAQADNFINFKLKTLVNSPPVLYSQFISREIPPKHNSGLDAVFMIGLVRRPDRRNRMLACLDELAFNYTIFDAVDGKQLNQTYIDDLGIHYLPGWKDPWGERPMTFGEIGCFLSHHTIWERMVSEKLQEVLILEDDVDFEPNFRDDLEQVLEEAHRLAPQWDLIYVGRKVLNWETEKLLPGATKLVRPGYSYWTLGYLISLRGAKKLIGQQPFQKMLPVDEYLPILFNVHPQKDWAAHFPVRNLNALSAYPVIVNPTHYVGDEGWFSDTEPPPDILAQIRERKKREEEEEERKLMEEKTHQERVKEDAINRQIQAMRQKLKATKTEL